MSESIIIKSDTEQPLPCRMADLDQWMAWVSELRKPNIKIDREKENK